MMNNAPVYTLYLTDLDGTENTTDHSWSWQILWRNVLPPEPKYENYIMTHSFQQSSVEETAIPDPTNGTVVQTGFPLLMNSGFSGPSSILNTWHYELISSNVTNVQYVSTRVCNVSSMVIGGTHSLVSSVITLKFKGADNTVEALGTNWIHTFKFTPVLNT